MITLANPQYLWLLFALPIIIALLYYGYRRRRCDERRFAELPLLKQLKPEATTLHRILRNALAIIAATFLIIALARPQLFRKKEIPNEEKGIEAMIVMDVSNSMLATDLSPNRLEFAKITSQRVVDALRESKIGLVVFAADAYTHLPITTDIASVKTFISDCSAGMLTSQGTAIAPAIEKAAASFSSRDDIGKAIILFTDGENHDSDAVAAAKKAAESGIKVFAVTVGSTEGERIPIEGGYLRDENGQEVVSRANPQLCKSIAEAGEGAAFVGESVVTLSRHLRDELYKLPQGAVTSQAGTTEELYGWFVAAAFICLFLMQFILMKKNKYISRLHLFDR